MHPYYVLLSFTRIGGHGFDFHGDPVLLYSDDIFEGHILTMFKDYGFVHGISLLSQKRRFLRRTFYRPTYTSKSSIAASKAVSISKSHNTGISS